MSSNEVRNASRAPLFWAVAVDPAPLLPVPFTCRSTLRNPRTIFRIEAIRSVAVSACTLAELERRKRALAMLAQSIEIGMEDRRTKGGLEKEERAEGGSNKRKREGPEEAK